MATPLAMRKRLLLGKLESTYATDPSPATADTLLVRNLNYSPLEGEVLDREFVRPYMGRSGIIRVSSYAKLDFEVEVAGSGTAGSPPAWGFLLKACGFSATTTAAPITGTAQAGAANTITLAADASATHDFYNGMPLSLTGGTGDGQSAVIIDYHGTTKLATVSQNWTTPPDATTTYSIGANVGYLPVSSLEGDSCTFYFYLDGVKHIMLGARGTFSLSLSARQIPVLKFSFMGLCGAEADVAFPTPDFAGWQKPKVVASGNTTNLVVQSWRQSILESLDIDLGNTLVHRLLVGDESVLITDRRVSGRIKIEATKVAAKNWWSAIKNGTDGLFCVQQGTAAGGRVIVTAPNLYLDKPAYEDQDGFAMMSAECAFFTESAGGNDEIKITVC
jgi:hypothetical protein